MDGTVQSLSNKLYDLSVACGMNQRYYQVEWTRWSNVNVWIAAAVAVLTAIAAMLTVAAYFKGKSASNPPAPRESAVDLAKPSRWMSLSQWSAWVSVFSFLAAVVLNVTPTHEWAHSNSDMFCRWSDLRQQVDNVANQLDHLRGNNEQGKALDLTHLQFLQERYRDLYDKKGSLNAMEPAPNVELLEKCLVDEERARGVPQDQDLTKSVAASGDTNIAQ